MLFLLLNILLLDIAHAEPDQCRVDHPVSVEEMRAIFNFCTIPVGTTISVQVQEVDPVVTKPRPGIGFKPNDAELNQNGRETLDGVAGILSARKKLIVTVVGYADSQEQGDLLQISRMRAESAYKYITSKGIDPSRIHIEAGGTQNPVDESDTHDGHARNRRVEFVVSAS
jgi:outer membrane protein OmpA-like peptidoglycan-associated protein